MAIVRKQREVDSPEDMLNGGPPKGAPSDDDAPGVETPPDDADVIDDDTSWAEDMADDDNEDVVPPKPEPKAPEPAAAQPQSEPSAEPQPVQPEPEAKVEPAQPAAEPEPEAPQPAEPATPEPAAQPEAQVLDLFGAEGPKAEPAPDPAQPQPAEPPKPATPEVPSREAVIQHLSQMYALTEEQTREYDVEPTKVLPQLAAKMHEQIVQTVVAGIMRELPSLVNGMIEQKRLQTRINKAFFKAWPKLAKGEYVPTIKKHMHIYSTNNPQAELVDLVRNVGASVMVAHQIPLENAPQQQPPASPVPKPVQPVSATSTPAARDTKPKGNWAENYAEEIILDDEDEI